MRICSELLVLFFGLILVYFAEAKPRTVNGVKNHYDRDNDGDYFDDGLEGPEGYYSRMEKFDTRNFRLVRRVNNRPK